MLIVAQSAYDYSFPTPTATTLDLGGAGAALGIGLGMIALIGIIGLAGIVFWIWMLVDVIRRQFVGDNEKIIWIVVVVLLGLLGAIIYYFAGRSKGRLPESVASPPMPSSPPPVASESKTKPKK